MAMAGKDRRWASRSSQGPARPSRAADAQPQRILLVRLSAIGDLVFASPLISSARRAYPKAHLAWLVQPEYASLLAHHPDLDEVIEWPLPRWRRLWRQRRILSLLSQVQAAVKALRAQRFDLAIDLQGLLKSALPVRWCGARQRIGLGSKEASQILMTQVVGRGPDSRLISSEYRHLAARLGWPVESFRMRVYPSRAAEAEAEALIAEYGLGAGYVVVCPFTTRPQKHWLDQRWAALAMRIRAELGLPIVMLGAPADRQAAQAILAGAGAGRAGAGAGADTEPLFVDLVGATSLLGAAALIRAARLLVGVDTGLSHMAIAFERPAVLLFGSTCPYLETGSATARVLYSARSCSPCRRRPTCDGLFSCMRDLEVDAVMATLTELSSDVAQTARGRDAAALAGDGRAGDPALGRGEAIDRDVSRA